MAPSPDPLSTAPASGEPLAASRHSHAGFSWAKFNQGVLPTLLAGVMAGLMLFTLNESSNRMTRIEDRMTRLEEGINTRFVRLEADIDTRFAKLEADIDTRFAKLEADIDTRFAKLEENQQEIAQTLARLVALTEAHYEPPANPSG